MITAHDTVTRRGGAAVITVTPPRRAPSPRRRARTPTPTARELSLTPSPANHTDVEIAPVSARGGSTIRVTATPDEGWELLYVTVDGERIEGMSFKMPAHDVTVSAVFAGDLPFADVAEGAWY